MTERDDAERACAHEGIGLPGCTVCDPREQPAQREQADVTAEDRAAAVLALFGGWEASELQRAMGWAERGSVNHWPLTREEAREVGVWARVLARHRIEQIADLRAKLERCERERDEARSDYEKAERMGFRWRDKRDAATARAETAERLLRDVLDCGCQPVGLVDAARAYLKTLDGEREQ